GRTYRLATPRPARIAVHDHDFPFIRLKTWFLLSAVSQLGPVRGKDRTAVCRRVVLRQAFPLVRTSGDGNAADVVIGTPGLIFFRRGREDQELAIRGERKVVAGREGVRGRERVAVAWRHVARFAACGRYNKQVLALVLDPLVPVPEEESLEGTGLDRTLFG